MSGPTVYATVKRLGCLDVRPWSQCEAGAACLFLDGRCVWAGPLERVAEDLGRFPGAGLALHPEDHKRFRDGEAYAGRAAA